MRDWGRHGCCAGNVEATSGRVVGGLPGEVTSESKPEDEGGGGSPPGRGVLGLSPGAGKGCRDLRNREEASGVEGWAEVTS